MMPRFLADEMLGDVVKWLRIMGYEAMYRKGESDKALLERAKKGLVLLTSDRELYKMSTKYGVKCILLEGESIDDKLVQTFRKLNMKPSLKSTRCTVCGGELEVTKRKSLRPMPSSKTIWICRKCGKMYWKGSHWVNIAKRFKQVENRLTREKDKSQSANS